MSMHVKTRMPRLSRMSTVIAALVGLAVMLTGCGSVYDLPLPGGANVGSNPLKIHVLFSDAMDLVPQSSVRVNDVPVGKITGVKLETTTTGCPAAEPSPCQVADVSIEIPNNSDLPSNAQATIQQTSLLGEKFVALSAPADPASTKLKSGDTIGLPDSGTNPQVEQVLEALGALLSGGGVGQLKVISDQLNQAIGGKESQVRTLLSRLHYLTAQLSGSKGQIVSAINNLNRLAVSLKKQDPTIVATLNDIPGALASVNGQRADLVKLLTALNKLSNVGVNVIEESKTATIDSLTDLAPVLKELAAAGNYLPDTLQIALTYPFVDGVVGSTPAAARSFEMGDYVNLAINLDLNLLDLTIPGLPGINLQGLVQLCNGNLKGACAGLAPVVNGLCSGLLKGTPICAGNGVSGSSVSKKTTSKKTTTTPAKKKASGGSLGGLNLGSLTNGLLGRTSYGTTGTGTLKRTSGDGVSYLLMQGALQ